MLPNWLFTFYKNRSKPFRLFLWVALVWSSCFLCEFFFQMPALHPFPIFLLGFAIFIFIERPFVNWGLSSTAELSISTAMVLTFMFHFGDVVIVPMMKAEEVAALPCAPHSPEMQCYTLSKEVCDMAWEKFNKDCKEEIRERYDSNHRTNLVGPIVKKCVFKKLDQAFHSTRRIASTSACQNLFSVDDAPTAQ